MKKIFRTMLLASFLFGSVAMISSCGGDKKKADSEQTDDNNDPGNNEENYGGGDNNSNSFSKAKVEYFYEKMMEYEARGDRDAAMELAEEMMSWYNSLSDADKKKADDYADELRGI